MLRILYLVDVDENMGPFQFVAGSQPGGPYADVWGWQPLGQNYPTEEELEGRTPAEAVRTFTGPAGSFLFCNTAGFHRRGFSTTRPRLLATATYSSPASLASLTVRSYEYTGALDALDPTVLSALTRSDGSRAEADDAVQRLRRRLLRDEEAIERSVRFTASLGCGCTSGCTRRRSRGRTARVTPSRRVPSHGRDVFGNDRTSAFLACSMASWSHARSSTCPVTLYPVWPVGKMAIGRDKPGVAGAQAAADPACRERSWLDTRPTVPPEVGDLDPRYPRRETRSRETPITPTESYETSDTAAELLAARRAGPVVVSYAQNAEDIRLWRVLGAVPNGFYVDVGAGHPIRHSVTKLFYDAGWNGINVEPGPDSEMLRRLRERDVNLDVAIASEPGEVDLWITSPDPGLSSFIRPDEALLPHGFTVSGKTVRAVRLDDVLRQHAAGREIDFLNIDVEGAEGEVLQSLDLREFRPRIVVAGAVSAFDFRPSHEKWEPLLVEAGYLPACFDGVNRFYVRDDDAALTPVLEYPITHLDRFVLHDSKWRRDSSLPADIAQGRESAAFLPGRSPINAEAEAVRARQQLKAIQATLSWRVTRPLRMVRRLQRGVGQRLVGGANKREEDTPLGIAQLERACTERLRQAVTIFAGAARGGRGEPGVVSLEDAAWALEAAMESSPAPYWAKAWVALTAVDGRYPDDETVDAAARLLRVSGRRALVPFLQRRFEEALTSNAATTVLLDVVRDGIVIVSETAVLGDLHTGIQRVARETVSRWLDPPSRKLAFYDDAAGSLKLLSLSEHERVRRWRDHMPRSGSAVRDRKPEVASDNVLVPWNCRILVTELLLRRSHSRALATIARAGVSRTLSFICFDLIPVVAPEATGPGLPEAYCDYLAAVKRADRVSAISEQSARDFRAYVTMLEAEGLRGPEIRAHSLPTPAPSLSEEELAAGTATLELEGLPLVLVVGVHVPRKNHLAVLEAAERLWMEGNAFELLFIGGFDRTSGREFDGYVHRLRGNGWPVRVRRRASETELWAAYATARFTVYPSLLEGFGLPVGESLASGTPVITSSYGCMAEIGAGGGAVLVDPRDIDELTTQMRRLLSDDELLAQLRREARARDLGRWEDYARDVWEFLTVEPDAR